MLWGNRGNAALTHLIRLLATHCPNPPLLKHGKENPRPDPDVNISWVEAVLTRFSEGASINMSTWSPLDAVTMAETVEAMRKSSWL